MYPYMRELEMSGGSTKKLLEAMQFLRYFGTNREGEGRLGLRVQEFGEAASESWYGTWWGALCITCI